MQKDKKKRLMFGLAVLNSIPLNAEASLREQSDSLIWSVSAATLTVEPGAAGAAVACSLAVNARHRHFQLLSFPSLICVYSGSVLVYTGKKEASLCH